MALPLFALTLFVSAFILFLVQPIVGKIILPKLGGTPQVWNTCMVFFQMVLLAGYAYTHNATSRLSVRKQLIAHGVLLLLPLIILLPFPFALGGQYIDGTSGTIKDVSSTTPVVIAAPGNKLETGMRTAIEGVEGSADANGTWYVTKIDSDHFSLDGSRGSGTYKGGGTFVGGTPNPHSLWGFVPVLGANPIPSTLAVLFLYVALPFLVVATSAPLLQKWFVHTGHPAAKDPYFLYGASNLGSMLSLIIYPILVEPYARLKDQGWIYTGGYLALIVFVMACVVMVWNSKEALKSKPITPPEPPRPEPAPSAAASTPAAETGITATVPSAAAPVTTAAATALKSGAPPAKPPGAGKGPGKHAAGDASIRLPSDEMSLGRRLRWIMLAAIPSSLMLGITTHITTDLSPQPMFWLVPLILYLASFIFVFARWPVVWTEAPHRFMVWIQPFCIAGMILVDVLHLTGDTRFLVPAMFAHVLGFFATTMVCHGELAKDRPSTRHLTEFYLLMSVGGMLGGIFNGLIAPIVFQWGIWEFPLCIFAAALARPKMFDTGLFDNFLATIFEAQPDQPASKQAQKGARHAAPVASGVTANESLVQTLDFAWAGLILATVGILAFFLDRPSSTMSAKLIAYFVPLALCCICLARPIRFGLGIGAVLGVWMLLQFVNDASIVRSRSYFGAVSVKESAIERGGKLLRFRQLIHGHIDHGMNFVIPEEKKDRGNPQRDLSRLATTYYHREGPVGRVMEKFNWFPGPPNSNTYWADARMPASLVLAAAADVNSIGLPMTELVTAWSEPPIATIGLGTGTMASYGRPYQHVHFYEIDNQIQRFSLVMPTRKITTWPQYKEKKTEIIANNPRRETYFNYLEQAIERGGSVQVLMGDARLRMAMPYKNHYLTELKNEPDDGGGPQGFYHMMVVDAFSSDAIPAHLLTEEAFRMYFEHLSEKGILCVHTSNRFVDLPKVVAAVTAKLNFAQLRGHDADTDRDNGHYTSEWVMVARKAEYLENLSGDTEFLDRYSRQMREKQPNFNEQYWAAAHVNSRYLWTDDYYNLLSVVRFRPRQDD